MKKVKITIAICTYRRFKWLGRCLNALQKQTLAHDEYKIIVVDNSLSKSESIDFRDSFTLFDSLEYIITEKSGLSYARNVAIERCDTPLIAFIDDDAMADPNWAEKIIDAFQRYPAAGVVGGKVNPIWEVKPPSWLQGELLHCFAVLDWGENDLFVDENKWLVGANVAYRTDVLRQCNGFNVSLGRKGSLLLAHEELATNISIQSYGYDIMYVPSIKVSHLIQKERLTKEWIFKDAMWEGASRFIYEHGIENVDSKEIRNCFEKHLVGLEYERFSDQEKIIETKSKVNIVGREVCHRLSGFSGEVKNDIYFSNLVSVVYIATPSFNAEDTIDQTVFSILTQAGNFSIRYHIKDGGSSDGTLEKIKKWEKRLKEGVLPIQCKNIVFTFESCPDKGMYDALTKGFGAMSIPPNAFMTWINADDILMPGALALILSIAQNFSSGEVSWVSGSACVVKENIQVLQCERELPVQAIKAGLCDGAHWNVVQQEGTFFRKWLWDKVEADTEVANFKYAGDWNLWRLFARCANIASAPWPLAAFRMREGQLSQKHGDSYQFEIESVVGTIQRDIALRNIVDDPNLKSYSLAIDYPSGKISLIENNAKAIARHFYDQYFNNNTGSSANGENHVKQSSMHVQNDAGNYEKSDCSDQHKSPPLSFLKNNDANEVETSLEKKITALSTTFWNKMLEEDNGYHTYARRSHWNYFKGLDELLYGNKIDLNHARLKYYQDLFVLSFIKMHLPPGSRILEVGGGNSRILNHLYRQYECWNIDKLEGVGNDPKTVNSPPYRLITDYMGNFNSELPEDFFHLVFSISALEHVPEDNLLFDNIIDDIDRTLVVGGYSLHLLDIIFKKDSFISNGIAYRMFDHAHTLNRFIVPEKIASDPDLYYMSESTYNEFWAPITNKKYHDFGKPSCLNILWKKHRYLKSETLDKYEIDSKAGLTLTPETDHFHKKSEEEGTEEALFTFFITTPCLNLSDTIDRTIESVVLQSGNFIIRYHIQDGGSTDGTIDRLKAWETRFRDKSIKINCIAVDFSWSSESDNGMYDAIQKGFDMMFIDSDDFMTWINGDDILMPGAFDKVANISRSNPEIQWVGGAQHVIDDVGNTVLSREMPVSISAIKEGLCDGTHYRFLQQEGIFFKKRLWFVGRHALEKFKFAGDWNLWREFAHHADFHQLNEPLGAFRRRDGQMSILHHDEYLMEINEILPQQKRKARYQLLKHNG